jgi:hypothetical protein
MRFSRTTSAVHAFVAGWHQKRFEDSSRRNFQDGQ